ncbi:type VI secretion system-associated protein TagF [Ruegeria sp. 2205SS24-7]|uniref:type VI secretion system-associated protein TagF n=1 Tax=Ruegeria discodermiae TaxID=3064389 RepID=UPI002741E43A|nr:type VI secretion system-associated protein TagF [Ruegeria sp. 2205SS24-7]MDP5217101.1 type VI secretion system-associated protein TagF [Ruegeria sp. 2205SS24-7]
MDHPGFGAFGKMPSVGDFFRLNVPASFVQVWDEWIQRGMLDGQGASGQAWDGLYMSAPIWRFCLSPGLAGPQKMLGVLMPSVDRVGRRFPLTLTAPASAEGSAILDHFRETALYLKLEDVALAALEDDMTKDRLAEALAGLPAPQRRSDARVRKAGSTLILTQGEGIGDILPDLASGLMAGEYRAPSIWSTEIAGVPRLMVCEGLPTAANMQGLFNLTAAIWTEARPI